MNKERPVLHQNVRNSSEETNNTSSSTVENETKNLPSHVVNLKESKTHLFYVIQSDNENSGKTQHFIQIKISKDRPPSRKLRYGNKDNMPADDQEKPKKTHKPGLASIHKRMDHPSFMVLPEVFTSRRGNVRQSVDKHHSTSENSNETYVIRSKVDNKLGSKRKTPALFSSLWKRNAETLDGASLQGAEDFKLKPKLGDYCECDKEHPTGKLFDKSDRDLLNMDKNETVASSEPITKQAYLRKDDLFNIKFGKPTQKDTPQRLRAGQDFDRKYKSCHMCPNIKRIFPPTSSRRGVPVFHSNNSNVGSNATLKQRSGYVKINFKLVRQCLINGSAAEKCEVLDAIRLRLKSPDSNLSVNTIDEIVKFDLFGVQCECRSRPLLEDLLWPLTPSYELQTSAAKFVNALVSYKIGRNYFNKRSVIHMLVWGDGDITRLNIDPIMCDNLMGVMMKLSFSRFQRSDMIENGLLRWLLQHMEGEEYSASKYQLQCMTALLGNLLRGYNLEILSPIEMRKIIVLLGRYLDTDNVLAKQNVCSSLLTLFQNLNCVASAKELNFERVIQEHATSTANSKQREHLRTIYQLLNRSATSTSFSFQKFDSQSEEEPFIDADLEPDSISNVDYYPGESLLREKFSGDAELQQKEKTCNKFADVTTTAGDTLNHGRLISRVFVEHLNSFLPNIESNRIFPLFNTRCADKVRTCSHIGDIPPKKRQPYIPPNSRTSDLSRQKRSMDNSKEDGFTGDYKSKLSDKRSKSIERISTISHDRSAAKWDHFQSRYRNDSLTVTCSADADELKKIFQGHSITMDDFTKGSDYLDATDTTGIRKYNSNYEKVTTNASYHRDSSEVVDTLKNEAATEKIILDQRLDLTNDKYKNLEAATAVRVKSKMEQPLTKSEENLRPTKRERDPFSTKSVDDLTVGRQPLGTEYLEREVVRGKPLAKHEKDQRYTRGELDPLRQHLELESGHQLPDNDNLERIPAAGSKSKKERSFTKSEENLRRMKRERDSLSTASVDALTVDQSRNAEYLEGQIAAGTTNNQKPLRKSEEGLRRVEDGHDLLTTLVDAVNDGKTLDMKNDEKSYGRKTENEKSSTKSEADFRHIHGECDPLGTKSADALTADGRKITKIPQNENLITRDTQRITPCPTTTPDEVTQSSKNKDLPSNAPGKPEMKKGVAIASDFHGSESVTSQELPTKLEEEIDKIEGGDHELSSSKSKEKPTPIARRISENLISQQTMVDQQKLKMSRSEIGRSIHATSEGTLSSVRRDQENAKQLVENLPVRSKELIAKTDANQQLLNKTSLTTTATDYSGKDQTTTNELKIKSTDVTTVSESDVIESVRPLSPRSKHRIHEPALQASISSKSVRQANDKLNVRSAEVLRHPKDIDDQSDRSITKSKSDQFKSYSGSSRGNDTDTEHTGSAKSPKSPIKVKGKVDIKGEQKSKIENQTHQDANKSTESVRPFSPRSRHQIVRGSLEASNTAEPVGQAKYQLKARSGELMKSTKGVNDRTLRKSKSDNSKAYAVSPSDNGGADHTKPPQSRIESQPTTIEKQTNRTEKHQIGRVQQVRSKEISKRASETFESKKTNYILFKSSSDETLASTRYQAFSLRPRENEDRIATTNLNRLPVRSTEMMIFKPKRRTQSLTEIEAAEKSRDRGGIDSGHSSQSSFKKSNDCVDCSGSGYVLRARPSHPCDNCKVSLSKYPNFVEALNNEEHQRRIVAQTSDEQIRVTWTRKSNEKLNTKPNQESSDEEEAVKSKMERSSQVKKDANGAIGETSRCTDVPTGSNKKSEKEADENVKMTEKEKSQSEGGAINGCGEHLHVPLHTNSDQQKISTEKLVTDSENFMHTEIIPSAGEQITVEATSKRTKNNEDDAPGTSSQKRPMKVMPQSSEVAIIDDAFGISEPLISKRNDGGMVNDNVKGRNKIVKSIVQVNRFEKIEHVQLGSNADYQSSLSPQLQKSDTKESADLRPLSPKEKDAHDRRYHLNSQDEKTSRSTNVVSSTMNKTPEQMDKEDELISSESHKQASSVHKPNDSKCAERVSEPNKLESENPVVASSPFQQIESVVVQSDKKASENSKEISPSPGKTDIQASGMENDVPVGETIVHEKVIGAKRTEQLLVTPSMKMKETSPNSKNQCEGSSAPQNLVERITERVGIGRIPNDPHVIARTKSSQSVSPKRIETATSKDETSVVDNRHLNKSADMIGTLDNSAFTAQRLSTGSDGQLNEPLPDTVRLLPRSAQMVNINADTITIKPTESLSETNYLESKYQSSSNEGVRSFDSTNVASGNGSSPNTELEMLTNESIQEQINDRQMKVDVRNENRAYSKVPAARSFEVNRGESTVSPNEQISPSESMNVVEAVKGEYVLAARSTEIVRKEILMAQHQSEVTKTKQNFAIRDPVLTDRFDVVRGENTSENQNQLGVSLENRSNRTSRVTTPSVPPATPVANDRNIISEQQHNVTQLLESIGQSEMNVHAVGTDEPALPHGAIQIIRSEIRAALEDNSLSESLRNSSAKVTGKLHARSVDNVRQESSTPPQNNRRSFGASSSEHIDTGRKNAKQTVDAGVKQKPVLVPRSLEFVNIEITDRKPLAETKVIPVPMDWKENTFQKEQLISPESHGQASSSVYKQDDGDCAQEQQVKCLSETKLESEKNEVVASSSFQQIESVVVHADDKASGNLKGIQPSLESTDLRNQQFLPAVSELKNDVQVAETIVSEKVAGAKRTNQLLDTSKLKMREASPSSMNLSEESPTAVNLMGTINERVGIDRIHSNPDVSVEIPSVDRTKSSQSESSKRINTTVVDDRNLHESKHSIGISNNIHIPSAFTDQRLSIGSDGQLNERIADVAHLLPRSTQMANANDKPDLEISCQSQSPNGVKSIDSPNVASGNASSHNTEREILTNESTQVEISDRQINVDVRNENQSPSKMPAVRPFDVIKGEMSPDEQTTPSESLKVVGVVAEESVIAARSTEIVRKDILVTQDLSKNQSSTTRDPVLADGLDVVRGENYSNNQNQLGVLLENKPNENVVVTSDLENNRNETSTRQDNGKPLSESIGNQDANVRETIRSEITTMLQNRSLNEPSRNSSPKVTGVTRYPVLHVKAADNVGEESSAHSLDNQGTFSASSSKHIDSGRRTVEQTVDTGVKRKPVLVPRSLELVRSEISDRKPLAEAKVIPATKPRTLRPQSDDAHDRIAIRKRNQDNQGENVEFNEFVRAVRGRESMTNKNSTVEDKVLTEKNLRLERQSELNTEINRGSSSEGFRFSSDENEENCKHKVRVVNSTCCRQLLNDDELINRLSEKVLQKLITKIHSCGPNCKSPCGGLNSYLKDRKDNNRNWQ